VQRTGAKQQLATEPERDLTIGRTVHPVSTCNQSERPDRPIRNDFSEHLSFVSIGPVNAFRLADWHALPSPS
jgi:hypothetical protein